MIAKLVKHSPLLAFFVLAYAFSWIFWLLMIVFAVVFQIRYDAYAWPMLWLMGLWGPSLSALVVTGIEGGKVGVRALLGRLLRWRVGWHLPPFWAPGSAYDVTMQGQPFLQVLGNFAAYVLPSTSLFTWLYNNAKGSVLLCMLLHASNNASGGIARVLGVTDYVQFNLVNTTVI
jgi:hypothetical protein